jgi:hypothetical protein
MCARLRHAGLVGRLCAALNSRGDIALTNEKHLGSGVRRRIRVRHSLIAAVLVTTMSNSVATGSEDSGTSMLSFSGFGTLGVVHSSEDQADFTSSIFSPNGAGHTRSWSADVDSVVGAQIIANVTPRLSAMLQVISEQNYDGTYTPHVEWANIKYQFTSDLSVRIGRTVLPSFLYSDTRKIGYANPWVRPPVEAYSLVPIGTSDGVDASYDLHFGEFLSTLVVAYGHETSGTPAGSNNEARRLLVIADTIEHGPATVHVAYQQTYLTVNALGALFDAFRQFGPQGAALADQYGVNNRLIRFMGIGAMYNPGRWFVMGEWGVTNYESVLGKNSAWYASSGYRLGQFTPYLTFGGVRSDDSTSSPGLTVAALPPNLAQAAIGLNGALNSILSSSPDQKTISEGVRWDFVKNVDLKLQCNHIQLGAGSPGTLINLQPGFKPGSIVNLFSAAIDFVF